MTKEPIKNKIDIIAFFDVTNGNPNGDPDAANMPRVDIETNHGIVTDVCLKSKIRKHVKLIKKEAEGYKIYIQQNNPLEVLDKKAYEYLGVKEGKELKKDNVNVDEKINKFMVDNFYDIRTFGGVMTTYAKDKLKCGKITGPVQFGFARSIEPILPQEITITRQAITTIKDHKEKETEIGKKYIVPYALYKVEGYISANLAEQTGFNEDDLNLLYDALLNMFENDHSAARGNMAMRKVIIFKHNNKYGNTQSYKLFDAVKVTNKNNYPARSYNDYQIEIDKSAIPKEVEVTEL